MKFDCTVLVRVLSNYLQTNKRLVIPQLGTFLVKEPSREILFSELIRRDDGILRGLLVAEGMSELAAQGEIDRFVFEVRHAIEEGRSYIMEGFGQLSPGANATIQFRRIASIVRPVEAATRETAASAANESAPARSTVTKPIEPLRPMPEPIEEPHAEEEPLAAAADDTEPTDEPDEAVVEEPHLTESAKMNPAPYVKGLSYGKPPKNTDAFTYVDRPPRRRKVDSFLVVAILAAVIALGAIAYGYYHDWQERRAEQASIEQLEALLSTDAPTDTTDATDQKE